jgi:hypothetical protein
MANNRLYIRCRACGEVFFVGKSFLAGFYYGIEGQPLEDKLNAFYDKHTYCCKDPDRCSREDEHCASDGCYELVYEMADWKQPCNEQEADNGE